MPEINRVPFKYSPVGGKLYLGSFRSHFYMERLEDVKETLQYLCAGEDIVFEIQGELHFTDDPDYVPVIRGLRYAPGPGRPNERPFDDTSVALWSER